MSLAPAQMVNGAAAADADSARRLAAFHEKLVRLQNDVFAGRHPRIKLPDAVIEQVARQQSDGQALQSQPHLSAPAGVRAQVTAPIPTQPLPSTEPKIHSLPDKPHFTQGPPALPLASAPPAIEPALLTSPDDLARAEMHLRRKTIERILNDQANLKKIQLKDSGPDAMGQVHLDVSDILEKAFELVPPVSGIAKPPKPASASSDSFDENSYYSSKANSWSTEEGEVAEAVHPDAVEVQQAPPAVPHEPVQVPKSQLLQLPGDIQHAQGAAQKTPSDAIASADESDFYNDPPTATFEREESEYSPPAPEEIAPPQEERVLPGLGRPPAPNGRSVVTALSAAPQVSYNNVSALVAPQPSRVSPLATAKMPRMSVRDPSGGERQAVSALSRPSDHDTSLSGPEYSSPRRSRRQSPAAVATGPQSRPRNPKKRRREVEAVSAQERQPSGKRVARAADAEIKEEPVSPPPMAIIPDSGEPRYSYSRYPPRAVHEDIEIISPPRYRPISVHYRDADRGPVQYAYPLDEPASPTYIRVPSRSAQHRLERADSGLRRVASLQFANRPRSPGPTVVPYTIMSDGRGARAVSHTYFDRPVLSTPISRGESTRPRASRAASRSPPPPFLEREYAASARPLSPDVMLAPRPPPRPVVYDQHGNRYYAAPPLHDPGDPSMFSMRRSEGETTAAAGSYPRPQRDSAMRPPRRSLDLYDDSDPSMRMGPPPPPLSAPTPTAPVPVPVPHRLADPADVELASPRPYAPRAVSARPHAGAPLHEDPAPRRAPAYYDGMAWRRAEVQVGRSYSVRPEGGPREVVPVYAGRHESAQPRGEYVRRSAGGGGEGGVYREVSVVRRDGPQYAYAGGGRARFVEEDEDERVLMPREVIPYRMEDGGGISYRY